MNAEIRAKCKLGHDFIGSLVDELHNKYKTKKSRQALESEFYHSSKLFRVRCANAQWHACVSLKADELREGN